MSDHNPHTTGFYELHRFAGFAPSCLVPENGGADVIASCAELPPASPWALSRTRRFVDIAFALLILLLVAVPMLLLAACVRLTSQGSAIFCQQRVGLGGRLFKVYKFRSMAHTENEMNGPGLTKDGDYRVTPVGRFMRKFKLDELPQFFNILRGEMSLVGRAPSCRNMPRCSICPTVPALPVRPRWPFTAKKSCCAT